MLNGTEAQPEGERGLSPDRGIGGASKRAQPKHWKLVKLPTWMIFGEQSKFAINDTFCPLWQAAIVTGACGSGKTAGVRNLNRQGDIPG